MPGFLTRFPVSPGPVLLLLFLLFPLPRALGGAHDMEGKASWYGLTAHGKPTATGELFNRAALTAAHRTLPFGAIVRVRNLANNRSVLVRINDRGPFIRSRVLDVSLRAAHVLRMREAGIAPVAMEIVADRSGRPLEPRHSFFLLLAGEECPQEAHQTSWRLHAATRQPIRSLFSLEEVPPLFLLCTGPYATFQEAEAAFLTLRPAPLAIIEAPTAAGLAPRGLLARHREGSLRPSVADAGFPGLRSALR
ncbi:MAG: septal ring lytic transglycosylase RlpA family protein [Desulfovibrio sp.]|jgi:rare lipoprotein A|nr:septal ring lytic transglycosylase RlpA family protein [Desulfovibrio sp.]